MKVPDNDVKKMIQDGKLKVWYPFKIYDKSAFSDVKNEQQPIKFPSLERERKGK